MGDKKWEEGDGGGSSHLLLSRREKCCTGTVSFPAVMHVLGEHVWKKKKIPLFPTSVPKFTFFIHTSIHCILIFTRGIPNVTTHSQKAERWVGCWRALRPTRAFRWMAAASRRGRRTVVIYTATRARSVRQPPRLLKQETAGKMLKYI